MLPLHEEADSPTEMECNPWPGPEDPPSLESNVSDEKLPTENIKSDMEPVVPHKTFAETPLLTIGRRSVTPLHDWSMIVSTPSSTGRVPASRRISKEKAIFALSALNVSSNSSFSDTSIERCSVISYKTEKVAHTVNHIHDGRVRAVKHFCKHEPVDCTDELQQSSTSSAEEEEDNIWPGPTLSDDDLVPPTEEPHTDHQPSCFLQKLNTDSELSDIAAVRHQPEVSPALSDPNKSSKNFSTEHPRSGVVSSTPQSVQVTEFTLPGSGLKRLDSNASSVSSKTGRSSRK